MGTRASFFVGDPRDIEAREWLGCIAWDGYPSGLPQLEGLQSEEEFRGAVRNVKKDRNDFADPANGGWPFPWADDIFLTDYTYAWMDGRLQGSYFHFGLEDWEELKEELKEKKDKSRYEDSDSSLQNIPAPMSYDRGQPDSIMVITTRKE